jgi:hypothetical protein
MPDFQTNARTLSGWRGSWPSGPTPAAVGALRRSAWARRGHYVVGLAALAWIAGQIAVIGYASWMQPFFFGVGLAILGLAYTSDRGSRPSGHPGK